MAETTLADFKLYPEQLYSGYNEILAQNTDVFNGASNNAIRLIPEFKPARYSYEAFFQNVSSLVSRRDPAAVTSVADLQLTQDERITVKVERRIGPVKFTNDAFKKIGSDPGVASFLIGQQAAKAMMVDYLNTGLTSLVAAIRNNSNLEVDASSGTLTHGALVNGLKTFGDRASRIRAWLMHSKTYFDLMGQAITDKITNVADVVIYGGSPGTLGRPVIVTDDSALIDTSTSPDEYIVLGLSDMALDLTISEPSDFVSDLITGEENLAVRVQGEGAYNIGLKGYKYDVGNGGASPTAATLGTGSNWDVIAADDKDTAGFCILVQ